jgi:tetratricopeptide (TPR) repeat protein
VASVHVGAWEFERPLGRGGQGEVWAGRHLPTNSPAAFKLFTQLDEAGRSAWRDEARAVAGLSHPGVIVLHDLGALNATEAAQLGVASGSPWMAMDLAAGSLRGIAAAWTFDDLRGALDALLAALAHVHARGVLHLDIKPANVLRFADRLCLADFGVARLVREGARAGNAIGTPLYMAPEQITADDDKLGPWTDLYALGWLAWDLAEGHPWRARALASVLGAQLTEGLPPPPGSPALQAWVRRCLAKRPADRFASAADARRALAAVPSDTRLLIGPSGLDNASLTTFTITMSAPMLDAPLAARVDADPDLLAPIPLPPDPQADWRVDEPPRAPPLAHAGLGLYRLRAIPLTGRAEERDRLWEAFRAVGPGGAVVLGGAAGLGKTALSTWLVERVLESGTGGVLTTRCLPDGGFGHALGALCRDGLRRQPDQPGGLDARTEAVIRTLAGVGNPPIPLEDSGAVVHAMRSWLAALAERRPLVLLIDDAQFDPELVTLLQAMGPVPRVLVVLTVQDEALAERPAAVKALDALAATPLHLAPLGDADTRALLDHLLGLDGALADRVRERAGGNPLFAVQLVGDWVDRGILDATRDGFVLREGADVRLPDGLHATWRDRVERLVCSPDDLPALERAALLDAEAGSVRIDEWRAAGPVPPRLRDRLLDARLAVARGEGRFTLVHGMLREAILQGATDAGRLPDHHRACAAAVTAPARRGRHLHAAGDRAEAVPFLLTAAGIELNRDPRRSEALVRLATDAVDACTDPELPVLLCRLRAQLAQIRGDDAECARWLEAGLADAPSVHARAHVLCLLVDLENRRHDLAAAERWTRELEAMADTLPPALQGASLRLRGEVLLARGQLDDARILLEAAVAQLAQAAPGGGPHGVALNALGNLARRRGNYAEAARHYAASVELFRDLDQIGSVLGPLAGLGDALRYSHDLDGAERAYRELEAIAHTLGSIGRWLASLNLGNIALARGQVELAQERFDLAWAAVRDSGVRPFQSAALWGRLAVMAMLNDRDGFDAVLAELRERDMAEGTALRDPDHAFGARLAAAAWLEASPERAAVCAALATEQST